MDEHETGQLSGSAAEIYEEFFVPALFMGWPQHVLAAAEVRSGDSVLDVACGTGVLARAARARVGPDGSVTGVDINEGMLAVARSKPGDNRWEIGAAETLPFEANSFDRVVSQFGLMFFGDPVAALQEMGRVGKPDGRMAVAVWAALDDTPGYKAMAELLGELFGAEAAESLHAPYSMGNVSLLESLLAEAGIDDYSIQTVPGTAHFASLDAWTYTDIRGWTLAEVINDEGYARLRNAAPTRLSAFVLPDGTVEFAHSAHIITINL